MSYKKIIVIVGPTGAGKTDLAFYLAKKLNGVIINADSRSIYKFLDLGTDKPPKKYFKEVPHFLFDFVHPKKDFSAALFIEEVKKIVKNYDVNIVVGGTWFWIKALVEGWELPKVKPNIKLRKKLEKMNIEKLQEMLKKLDPERFKNLKENIFNKKRLIRAIEIAKSLGKVPKIKKKKEFEFLILGIKKDLEKLRKIIKKRNEISFKRGILKEIKNLHERHKLSFKRIISFGYRYHYFTLYLLGKISKEEAFKKLEKEGIKIAKTQIREFEKLKPIWIKNKKEALLICKKFLKDL
jgi:tRNA dimethylallyltransferase